MIRSASLPRPKAHVLVLAVLVVALVAFARGAQAQTAETQHAASDWSGPAFAALVCAVCCVVCYFLGELRAIGRCEKHREEMQAARDKFRDERNEAIEWADHCREKWERATTACRRFAAELAEARGEETPEQKLLVAAYNARWTSLPKYRLKHFVQLGPWERELAQTQVDEWKAISAQLESVGVPRPDARAAIGGAS